MLDGASSSGINRNMGCIEIARRTGRRSTVRKINRNMGCIEIVSSVCISSAFAGLIETWDVLKLTDGQLASFL